MLDNRDEILKLAREFHVLCKDNDIWYSLDKEMLLGAVKHGGFLPWSIKFQVFMTVDSYQKLKRIFNQRVVDSAKDIAFKSLKPVFVKNDKNWKEDQAFIEIRIAIPSSVKKINTFTSFYTTLIKKIKRQNIYSIKNVIDDLNELRFEGYFLVESRKRNHQISWIQALSKDIETQKVLGHEFYVAKEYDSILKSFFGESYFTTNKVPDSWKEFPAPTKVIEAN